jgi:mono/diheme cytochrome c family protein
MNQNEGWTAPFPRRRRIQAKCVLGSLLALGLPVLLDADQPAAAPMVFTAAQAQAGRVAYESSCGRCHTVTLMGRRGEPNEVPPIDSLPEPFLKFIGPKMRVPPLVGRGFVDGWGKKTLGELYTLFRGAADTTPVSQMHLSDEALVNITAYILEKNGAKAGSQPLTATNDQVFQSVVP